MAKIRVGILEERHLNSPYAWRHSNGMPMIFDEDCRAEIIRNTEYLETMGELR